MAPGRRHTGVDRMKAHPHHPGKDSSPPLRSPSVASTPETERAAQPSHEATWLRRETLPGLLHALDLPSLRSRLQEVFTPSAKIDALELHHVAYNPGKSARFAYRLRLRDRQGTWSTHFMSGLLRRHERISSNGIRLRDRAQLQPPFGPAFHHMEEWGLILLGFPNDAKLQGLEGLVPSRLSQRLSSQLEGAVIESSNVVRYVPGKRLVMCHVMGDGRRIYTKTFARDRGPTAVKIAERLWQESQEGETAFVVPRTLAYLPESQTMVQEGLRRWLPMQQPPPEGWEDWGRRVGLALARVHRMEPVPLPSLSFEDENQRLSTAMERLVRFDPSLQASCAEVWERARAFPDGLTPPSVPVHTAFRVTQMLTRGDRVALLDFEGFRLGDPHHDLGNLIAYLSKHVVDGSLERPHFEAGMRAFLEAYAASVPWRLNQEMLDWYVATHLVAGYAANAVSRLEGNLHSRLPRLLAEALRRFPACRTRGDAKVPSAPAAQLLARERGMVPRREGAAWRERVRLAVDSEHLAPHLSREFAGAEDDVSVGTVKVLYAASDAEGDFRAWYGVSPKDGGAPRYFSGFMREHQESRGAEEPRKSKRSWREHGSEGPRVLSESGMQVWKFPADPRLSGLSQLVNLEYAGRILRDFSGVAPGVGEVDVVRFVPGKRAVLRYTVGTEGAGAGASMSSRGTASSRSVFCKVYGSRKVATRAAERYGSFWELRCRHALSMSTPRLIHVDADTASLWFEALPGETLDAMAPDEALTRMGEGLAALHASGGSFPGRWSPKRELESTRRNARFLKSACPETAGWLHAIDRALESSLHGLDFGPQVPCHGSFKLNHVTWDGQSASLLDVDSALQASPWLDVANLVTHLHYLMIEGSLESTRMRALVAAFRRAYEKRAPWDWNEAALDWCISSLLVRKQASKCVKHLKPDVGSRVEALLHEAWARSRVLMA